MNEAYSVEFGEFWKAYPKRDRPDLKALAFKNWKTRLKEGITPELLIACAREYHAYVTRKGKAGTEFVLQAATFLGPHERFRPYEPSKEMPVLAQKSPLQPKPEEERVDGRPFLREILRSLAEAKKMPGLNYVRPKSA